MELIGVVVYIFVVTVSNVVVSGEVNFVVDDVEESLRNVEKVFDVDFDYLDGLTCSTENYWFNIRGSNTEPKLRVNVEGKSEKVITEVLEKISSNI